jgi:hypothetical protein
VCPSRHVVDMFTSAGADVLAAERNRLGMQRCPVALFPNMQPRMPVTLRWEWPLKRDTPAASSAVWSTFPPYSSAFPGAAILDYPAHSACHHMCPTGSAQQPQQQHPPSSSLLWDAGSLRWRDQGPTHPLRAWSRGWAGTLAFKDAADYVHQWWWGQTDEDDLPSSRLRQPELIPCCLLPGTIVAVNVFYVRDFCTRMLQQLVSPVVLFVGGSDETTVELCPELLAHPLVLHVFGTNYAINHPKITRVPIGPLAIGNIQLGQFMHIRYLQRQMMALQAAQEARTGLSASSLDECDLLSVSESLQLAAALLPCMSHNLECSLEASHLRSLLGLDDYVADSELQQLHRRTWEKPADSTAQMVHDFFQQRGQPSPAWSGVSPSANGPQVRGDESRHALSLRLPRQLAELFAADKTLDSSTPLQLSCRFIAPPHTLTEPDRHGPGAASAAPVAPAAASSSSFSSSSSPPPAMQGASAVPPLYARWWKLAVINFSGGTNEGVRGPIHSAFCSEAAVRTHSHWITCVPTRISSIRHNGDNPTQLETYAMLSEYMYVLSPEGHGLDCFRTWETLMMGSIPVLHHTPLDDLFADGDLPVLVVPSMAQLTLELLLQHAPRFAQLRRDFSRTKLLFAYWRWRMLRTRHLTLQQWFVDTAANDTRHTWHTQQQQQAEAVHAQLQQLPSESERARLELSLSDPLSLARTPARCWGVHLQPLPSDVCPQRTPFRQLDRLFDWVSLTHESQYP